MSEHHILVSTYSHDRQITWHAYMVRRNPMKLDVESDINAALGQLAEVVEQHADAWLPMLVSTKLSNTSGKKLQGIFVKKCPEFTTEQAWQTYTNKGADFFLTVVAMQTDDPDNKTLMGMH